MELGLAIDPPQAIKIANKMGCAKIDNKRTRIQHGPFVEVCRKIYFPDIPKGWKSMSVLSKTYGKPIQTITSWFDGKGFKCQRFQLGLQEVWFAEEEGFRRFYHKKRDTQRSSKHIGKKRTFKGKRKKGTT
jgi:hypothetical protein